MVAYHFPPHAGSSGIQRTLRFARTLPRYGWDPVILSVAPFAYEQTSDALLADLPADVPIYRPWALDAKRHLSLFGRYPGLFARPDRWRSWWLPGVAAGLAATWRHRPEVIWSTFPIATAHRIGATLAGLTDLPWVADLRDPMAHDGYPQDAKLWTAYQKVERRVFATARAVVTVTPGCAAYYANRYPDAAGRIHVIRNAHAPTDPGPPVARTDNDGGSDGRITLLHSGIVYPWERDPTALLQAIARLLAHDPRLDERLRVIFRAPGDESWLRAKVAAAGVQTVVEVAPPLAYRAALEEMRRASALLLLQADNCNLQIPAKLYEYAYSGRPVLTLSDPAGETWREATRLQLGPCARLDEPVAIAALIKGVLDQALPAPPEVNGEDYENRSAALASLLDRLAAPSRQ